MRTATKVIAAFVASGTLTAAAIGLARSTSDGVAAATSPVTRAYAGEYSPTSTVTAKRQPSRSVAIARLKDAAGGSVGRVVFSTRGANTTVLVRINRLPDGFARSEWHGMHIHANDKADNGEGCIADATQPSNTWFLSVDGHFKGRGDVHGNHGADFPSPYVKADGTAIVAFTTDEFTAAELDGKALLLHAGRDNFGNIPLGTAPDQYTANSPEAITKTEGTGNAGDRIACAIIDVK